jgi:hypothetical protein
MGRKVFIKVIPRDTVSKVSEFRNPTGGKKLNKTKISDKCKDSIQALYNVATGALATGLTPEMERQAEKDWGKPSGFFTNAPMKKGVYNHEDLTYYQRKSWKLNDGTTILDLDNIDDWCFYYVCLASKFVANSEKEWREHKWPKALYYIALENEDEEIKFKRNQLKSKAFAALENENLTLPWKRKFVVIMKKLSGRIEATEYQVNNLLHESVENAKLSMPGNDLEVFMKYFNLLATADGRDKLDAMYMLQLLQDYNIILEKAGTYTWLSKGTEIGYNYDEALSFLQHPKKQAQREDLEKELKLKRG